MFKIAARYKRFKFPQKFISSKFIIVFGIFFIFLSLLLRIYLNSRLSFKGSYPKKQESIGVIPSRIIIESVGVDLPIYESRIVDGVWQVAGDAANHLAVSARIGESGNMVIYAHNKKSMFGPLRYLKKDDLINVVGHDSARYSYKVDTLMEVAPSDIKYVLPGDDEKLTIYTCSGFADSKRFIVVAKPL